MYRSPHVRKSRTFLDIEQIEVYMNNFNKHTNKNWKLKNIYICKPEEGWYGQQKYCYKKQYTLF